MLGENQRLGGSHTTIDGYRDSEELKRMNMAADNRNTASISALCLFGADVGCRLVQLVKWVDGMPSVVKSLGHEIWAACEVLCELSNILARGQLNQRSTFFTAEAMREIEEYIETCDEVFHEAARGVLVAYDRMKVLRPKVKDKDKGKGKVDQFVDNLRNGHVEKIEKKPEPLQLSFQERVRWPLFQRRMFLMMEGLMNAKQDLTLHLLVYWVNWEHEHKKRSRSSIFSALSTSNRDALVEQLWQSKVRRDQDLDPRKISLGIPRSVSSNSSGAASIFALSNSGSQSPDDRCSYTASPIISPVSDKSDRSLLSRLTRKLSFSSSRKKLASVGLTPKKKAPEPMTGRAQRSSANDTWNTRTVGMRPQMGPSRPSLLETASLASMSASTDMQSMHSARPGLHRSASTRSALRGNSPSSYAKSPSSYSASHAVSYRGASPVGPPPPLSRKTSWSAGPTMGAKQGIIREWQALKGRRDYAEAVDFSDDEDDAGSLPWAGTEDELVQPDFRALGRQLLFRQLESMTPTWEIYDGEHASVTIDMLIEQWIEPGQFRRRRMEWENIVDGKRTYATSSSEGTSSSSGDGTGLKFHFSNR